MFCFKRNGKESLMDDLGQLLISWNLAMHCNVVLRPRRVRAFFVFDQFVTSGSLQNNVSIAIPM